MSTTRTQFNSACIGSDEANCGGLFGTSTTVSVALTEEEIKVLQSQSWFLDYVNFKRKGSNIKNEKLERYYSWEIMKILEKNIDYVIWNLSDEKYKSMYQEFYGDVKEIKKITHGFVIKKIKVENPKAKNLFVVVDRFWKKGEEEIKSKIFDKCVSNGEKKWLSIAIAETIAISYSAWKLKSISEDLGQEISYQDNHDIVKSCDKMWEFLEKVGDKKEVFKYCKPEYREKILIMRALIKK